MSTYRISKISDLQKVPAERRADCVREILYCIALADLTGVPLTGGVDWTDDGEKSATLYRTDGKPFLTLKVKKTSEASS